MAIEFEVMLTIPESQDLDVLSVTLDASEAISREAHSYAGERARRLQRLLRGIAGDVVEVSRIVEEYQTHGH